MIPLVNWNNSLGFSFLLRNNQVTSIVFIREKVKDSPQLYKSPLIKTSDDCNYAFESKHSTLIIKTSNDYIMSTRPLLVDLGIYEPSHLRLGSPPQIRHSINVSHPLVKQTKRSNHSFPAFSMYRNILINKLSC